MSVSSRFECTEIKRRLVKTDKECDALGGDSEGTSREFTSQKREIQRV